MVQLPARLGPMLVQHMQHLQSLISLEPQICHCMLGFVKVHLGVEKEPDSNENLAVQYRNNAGGWTTLQTWQGSTSGGGVTQYAVNLPSAAFHSSFKSDSIKILDLAHVAIIGSSMMSN